MKKTLTLILAVITVGCYAQTTHHDTIHVSSLLTKDYLKGDSVAIMSNIGKTYTYTNSLTIKGEKINEEIVLSDQFIEAIIKALEKKGYILKKKL